MPGEPVITYADDKAGVSEIRGQSLAGGPPRQITSLSGGTIKSFDWSPDGKQLVLSRGMQSFELLLLELGR
jgi:Tol biopolymer transport system component